MNYEYRGISEMLTARGVAFHAQILDNQHNLICDVYQAGNGGCNDYVVNDAVAFEAMKIDAVSKFGDFEPLDAMVNALWEETLIHA